MENSIKRYDSFSQMFQECTGRYTELPFLVSFGETITYGMFAKSVGSLSERMKMIGEDRIVLSVSNRRRFIEIFFATMISGHSLCLLPPGSEIPEHLENAYFIGDDFNLLPTGKRPYDGANQTIIVFSSGTTGDNVGIVLTPKNILTNMWSILEYYSFRQNERVLSILPFYHLFGLVGDVLMPFCCGAGVYILDNTAEMLSVMRSYRPNTINMPPSMADTLCELIKREQCVEAITGGFLRRAVCGGAPLSGKTFDTLLEYGILPIGAYGLTECSPCISVMPEGNIRKGTTGIPLRCWEISFSRDDEVLVRGDCVMKGYFGDEERTRSRIRDGWFNTGDIGYLDEEGFLVITGRANNMLVFSNGKKCIPEIIEERINCLCGVKESMVTKVGSDYGDHPGLYVVTDLKDEKILKDEIDPVMKEYELFPYELTIGDKGINRNSMGKMLRKGIDQ